MPGKRYSGNSKAYQSTSGGFTGRNKIFLDPDAVDMAIADLEKIKKNTIGDIKDALKKQIKQLNSCAGFSEAAGGSIDAGKIIEIVDISSEGIDSIIAQIESKEEEMIKYSESGLGEKVAGTTNMIFAKFGAGVVGAFEEIGDGILVVGSWVGGPQVDAWVEKRLKSSFADKTYEALMIEDLKSSSAITEDSMAANITYGFGTAVGYIGIGIATGGIGGVASKGASTIGKGSKVIKAGSAFLSKTKNAETIVATVGGLGGGTATGVREGKTLKESYGKGIGQAAIQGTLAWGTMTAADKFSKGGKVTTTSDDVLKGKTTDPKAVQNRIDDITGVNQNAATKGAPTSAKDSMFSPKNTSDEMFERYQANNSAFSQKNISDEMFDQYKSKNSAFSPKNTSDEIFKEYQAKNNLDTPIQNRINDSVGINKNPAKNQGAPTSAKDSMFSPKNTSDEIFEEYQRVATKNGAPTSANNSAFSPKNTSDEMFERYQANNSAFSPKNTPDDVFNQYQMRNGLDTPIQNRINDATGVNNTPASAKGAPTSADNSAFSPKNTSDEVFKEYQKSNGIKQPITESIKDFGKKTIDNIATKENAARATYAAGTTIRVAANESAVENATYSSPGKEAINDAMTQYRNADADSLFKTSGEKAEETTVPTGTGGGSNGGYSSSSGGSSSNNDNSDNNKNDDKTKDETKKEETKTDETKQEDTTKTDETKTDETKTDDTKTDDTKTDETKKDETTTNPKPGPGIGTGGGSGGGGTHNTGGGYSGSQGYVSQAESNADAGVDSTIEDILDDSETSIDDVIKGNNYTKIPTSSDPITSKSSGGSMVIPVAAGLSAAAAAGIGAKAFLDKKNNNDNGETDDIETEEWENEETMDIEYAEDVENEQYLDEEDEFGYQEAEPAEKYGARSSQEITDLQ